MGFHVFLIKCYAEESFYEPEKYFIIGFVGKAY
jgi:hypothetical protein